MNRIGFLIAAGFAVTSLNGFAQTLKIDNQPNPSAATSLQAHWGTAPDGSPLLSWVETAKDGSHTLRYATRRGAQWSEPHTVVSGRHLFRQPAESPAVVALADGSLIAQWVEMPSDSSEAEYLYVSASKDGLKWTAPAMAHQDKSPVQHALASLAPSGDHEASVVWLEALKGEDAPSTLKRTVVSADGKVVKEESLDTDVCTCCPTSIVKTAKGLLVAYRDHTPQEIRDIATVRFENGHWLPSKILSADKWQINACPVNGASAAARDSRVAIAWHTEGGGSARTQLVLSADAGATFAPPVRISTGKSLGHVSAALDEQGGAIVSWLEPAQGAEGVRLLVRAITSAGVAGPAAQVAQGSRLAIGYPRLLHSGNETWIAWGNTGTAKIQTARLTK
jgi:hypothetical protein